MYQPAPGALIAGPICDVHEVGRQADAGIGEEVGAELDHRPVVGELVGSRDGSPLPPLDPTGR
jgi:hypothetical protein